MIPQRIIPSSKRKIPVLGLGTWKVFNQEINEQNLFKAYQICSKFKLMGGKLIDSSPMYGNAEELVGKILSKFSENEFQIATKVWTKGKQEGEKQIELSFKKINKSKIDIFQIHNLIDYSIHLKKLQELKEMGKIDYIGITHYLPSYFQEMTKIMKTEKIDFIQIPYSISLREAENFILPLANQLNIAVLINRPFEGGDLFNHFKNKKFDNRLLYFSINSWAELFIRFILSNSYVTSILFASSNLVHIEENMNSSKKELFNSNDLEKIYKIYKENL